MQFGVFSSVSLVDYGALEAPLVGAVTAVFTVWEVWEAWVQTLLTQFLADVWLAAGHLWLGRLVVDLHGVFAAAAAAGPARQPEGGVRTARLLVTGREVAVTVVLDAAFLLHDVVQVEVSLTEVGRREPAAALQLLIVDGDVGEVGLLLALLLFEVSNSVGHTGDDGGLTAPHLH